ncbi:hypothetical protein B0H13DRAFT_1852476 [Mycena leptocephala]|nr:hypothetical protein B0H13DRAFT_1852476 [Mycena leptocephala]
MRTLNKVPPMRMRTPHPGIRLRAGNWIAARLLAHEERLDTIIPAESVYHIPGKLQGKLDKTCFLVIVDHSIPAYLSKDLPLKRVQDHLEKYPSFGWTTEVKADKSKLKVLLSCMRTKLTHNWNNIKNLIIALGVRVAPETKLSLDFCVRVALLDYWTKVDDYLERLRVKNNNDPERIAEVFRAIYNKDTDMFKVKLGQKEHAALSAVQPEVFGNEET